MTIIPIRPRPEFAHVSLATDLLKLEEDYMRLQHRAQARSHSVVPIGLKNLNRDELARLIGGWANQCHLTRTWLMDGRVSFDCAKVIKDMAEAAFHVARRALSGLDPDEPVPYEIVDEVPC